MMKGNTKISYRQWCQKGDKKNYLENINFIKKNVVTLSELKNAIDSNWIFSHIPKTAGTSLENYLAQMFLIQNSIQINAPALNKFPEILSIKNKFPKYIAGHHPMHGILYQLLPIDKPFVHITMLRNPIDRVISYYNYLHTKKDHAKHNEISRINFDEFIQEKNLVEVSNGQSKRLIGILHLQNQRMSNETLFLQAKEVVDSCYTLVGVVEKFDEFLLVLEKQCHFKFHVISSQNRSIKKICRKNLSDSQLQKIKSRNKADIMLHQYVIEKFINSS